MVPQVYFVGIGWSLVAVLRLDGNGYEWSRLTANRTTFTDRAAAEAVAADFNYRFPMMAKWEVMGTEPRRYR